MTAKNLSKDIESIAETADPNEIRLKSGTTVEVQRLKTRQVFKLLKILTVNTEDMLRSLALVPTEDDESNDAFATQLIMLVAASVPDAEDETIEFIQSMILPEGYIKRPRSKADRDFNRDLIAELEVELFNPELEDLLQIMDRIVKNEAEELKGLGKQIRAMFRMNAVPGSQKNSSLKSSTESTPTTD